MEATPYRVSEQRRQNEYAESISGVPLLVRRSLVEVLKERYEKHSYHSFLQAWISDPGRMTVAFVLYSIVIALCAVNWMVSGPRLLVMGCLSALAVAIHASAAKNRSFSVSQCFLLGSAWGLGSMFAMEAWVRQQLPSVGGFGYMVVALLLWLAVIPAPYALLCRRRNGGYWQSDAWDSTVEIGRAFEETREALATGVYKQRSNLSNLLNWAKVYRGNAETREQSLRSANRSGLEGMIQLEKGAKQRFQSYIDVLTPIDTRLQGHEKTIGTLLQMLVSVVGEYPEYKRGEELLSDPRLAKIHFALHDEYSEMCLALGEGEGTEAYRKTSDALELGSKLG